MINDTISAISTALSASGVAVIRISGPSALNIAQKMFIPVGKTGVSDFEPNKMYVGEIEADGFKDYGMCVYFKAPKSFTGEDSVEFHCHGGIAITKGVLKKTLSLGARLATNGEFTKRAFLNGKLSLSSAEGLIDMINSESESGVKAGYYLYREKLTAEINAMQDDITDVLAQIDADMDFPEEDLEQTSTLAVENTLNSVVQKIDALLKTYRTGRTLKNGVRVAIVGKPNTGKSSLLNALLNYDKAIVSDVAGTTRDIVEGNLDINGVRFNFSDTAGIRESGDKVEEMGVSLSKKVLSESDVILFVLDGGFITQEDEQIYSLVKDKNLIVAINKTDKNDYKDDRADVYVSALKKHNLSQLKELLFEKSVGSGLDLNGDFLCEERHFNALLRAKEKLLSALNSIGLVTLDLLAIDVKDGWDALGEISGRTATEDIINDIFSKFCVGK
ncbi:MAG: tRNA uridine-5-carboxymethylaminomethyl(34) synthesis GTPase MnmE [Clostridiales bacterium]|nr:tRNA uridine-5-carboxymethylaminomethyl(34) synthesis GTPase MnmE [Clostridiales bacterium]